MHSSVDCWFVVIFFFQLCVDDEDDYNDSYYYLYSTFTYLDPHLYINAYKKKPTKPCTMNYVSFHLLSYIIIYSFISWIIVIFDERRSARRTVAVMFVRLCVNFSHINIKLWVSLIFSFSLSFVQLNPSSHKFNINIYIYHIRYDMCQSIQSCISNSKYMHLNAETQREKKKEET